MNVRILQRFTLRSPMSHIGETISTTAYLVQEPVIQPDGSVEEVFCYSGNAWRGQLRDLAATYMLDALGNPTIGLEAFHLLYSGGAIGGGHSTNIAQARQYRRSLPIIALFGGGVGNQILPGKLRVANAYPVCREAPPPIMSVDPGYRDRISYRDLTIEKSFSRKDDAKDERINHALAAPAPAQGQLALAGEPEPVKPEKEGAAQQMRMTVELLIAGAQLTSHIDCLDVSEVELGCLVSAIHAFSRSPHIGGQANRGHGLVALDTEIVDMDTGETQAFATVSDRCLLAPAAEQAKARYDEHLRSLYDQMLDSQGGEIVRMIGAA